jgi:uncharacterized protein YprB with RNaseH-like and TPR domain
MSSYPLNNILFLDIETVPQYDSFEKVPAEWQELWGRKADLLIRDKQADSPASIYGRAGIYAEFGKIICISCGIISGSGESKKLLLKSFAGDDEKMLLLQFCEMLAKWAPGQPKYLCAHNGKEFDFPFLCRRLIIHGMPVPSILNLSGKRPWEIPHLDTLELWKFGDYKNYTSLNLLARTLGIATPKDDIDGSRVAEVYWQQHDLARIVVYCQKDVITVAQVYLRLIGEATIGADYIDIK